MTEKDFKVLSKEDGFCLAFKDEDCIYPIFLSEEANEWLKFILSKLDKEIIVLKGEENRYKLIDKPTIKL